ncbi:uncharacterized protein LOC129948138 isoform X2 [Eupeodes corollae]|nr:uncharacterized protein LOC129942537 isoform X2 [Eupeodes corollae]XP_055914398.1 uncharacterized protein LOC129947743 isoform X3 [Eupeodes corollae]XP_055914971.1 uncharacterized protein LOC129948138 isoform X2 [Eupeodes corollae]
MFEHKLMEWRSSLGIGEQQIDMFTLRENSCSSSFSSSPTSSIREDPSAPAISLSLILKNSPKARDIEKFYEQNFKLQDIHRQALITLICEYFIDNHLHLNLYTSYMLEEQILQRFKGEKLEFYRTGKRGKIYAKFCNSKTSSRLAVKRSIFPKAENAEVTEKSKKKHLMEFTPEVDAEECIRSIKYDNLSTSEFDSCWQACSQFRLDQIYKETTLHTIFEEWPDYKKPGGYRLIDKDFGVVFRNSPGVLLKYPEQAGNLRKFLLDEDHLRDKNLRNMVNQIDENDIKTDSAAVKLFWCLHGYLIPTQKGSRKDNSGKSSTVRFTIKSSQEAFLFIGSSVQELDDHIAFLKSKSENIQPFILAVGDKDFENFSNYYVYLDGIKFVFSNFLRAIDICFKCFNLFNLEYPLACSQLWTFIEHYFYELNISKTKSPKMYLLIEALRKSALTQDDEVADSEAGLGYI